MGYALAYPGTILGIILTMIVIRRIFRAQAARDMLQVHADKAASAFINVSIVVENKTLKKINGEA